MPKDCFFITLSAKLINNLNWKNIMLLPTNQFKIAIKEKKPQVGLWVSSCSNVIAEIIAGAGYDWVVIDMEHSPNAVGDVLSQLQAFNGSNTHTIVRPMWNDSVVVKRLLDIGSSGLLFPMVQNVEEAKAAVAACKYPPHGKRGVAGTTRATKFGRITDYFEKIDNETTIIVQAETIEAMENIEAIASVDGVDGIFYGPADIGADMGILGKPTDPKIWKEISKSAKKCIDMGIPVGTLVGTAEKAGQLFDEGFTFVACGLDTGLLARASDTLLADVKSKLPK